MQSRHESTFSLQDKNNKNDNQKFEEEKLESIEKNENEKQEFVKKTETEKEELIKNFGNIKKEIIEKAQNEKEELIKKFENQINELVKKLENEKQELIKKLENEKKEIIAKLENEKKEIAQQHEEKLQQQKEEYDLQNSNSMKKMEELRKIIEKIQKKAKNEKLDSKLLTNDHKKTLELFIVDELCCENDELKWKLEYRATRDGFGAKKFHEKCDNLNAPSLVLIKSTNGSIFGGFTTKNWKTERFLFNSFFKLKK